MFYLNNIYFMFMLFIPYAFAQIVLNTATITNMFNHHSIIHQANQATSMEIAMLITITVVKMSQQDRRI